MKNSNRIILKIMTLFILIFVPFLKVFSMYLQKYNIIYNYDSINPAIVLYISIPILLYIYIYELKKRKNIDIYDYIFYILIITGVIVCLFSINKQLSIFGIEYRHEGFLSLISYYLLFINWKVLGIKESIEQFIKWLYIIGIFNCLYAFLQIYTSLPFILRYSVKPKMASGLCCNPNFFGSLIVTIISILTCELIINKKMKFGKILLLIIFFISLINCQSTGPFLSYILVLLFLIIYLSIKKMIIKKNLIILPLLIMVFIFTSCINELIVYNSNSILHNNESVKNEFLNINETINSGGNGRIRIWKNSIKIIKKHLVLGVGYDNFILAYPNPKISNEISFEATFEYKGPIIKYYTVYDNAHNIYLHLLASGGLLNLIPYLTLCMLTFIKGIKSDDKLMITLLSGFIAYSIQGFTNISVIQVAPIYFIIIGMLLSERKYVV